MNANLFKQIPQGDLNKFLGGAANGGSYETCTWTTEPTTEYPCGDTKTQKESDDGAKVYYEKTDAKTC